MATLFGSTLAVAAGLLGIADLVPSRAAILAATRAIRSGGASSWITRESAPP